MSKVIVYHGSFGCDTGCCGHYVEIDEPFAERFDFKHPWGSAQWGPDAPVHGIAEADARAFAEDLIRDTFGAEHVADLDWENCYVTVNC